ARYAADAGAHDARGLSADQATEEIAEARSADAADGGAGDFSLTGIGICDAGRDGHHRQHGQTRDDQAASFHYIGPSALLSRQTTSRTVLGDGAALPIGLDNAAG